MDVTREARDAARRDALKLYIFSLLASGDLRPDMPVPELLRRAGVLFAQDLPAAGVEIAGMLAHQGGSRVAAAVLGKVGDLLGEVRRRGVKAVWADVMSDYNRGVEAKHGPKKTGSRE